MTEVIHTVNQKYKILIEKDQSNRWFIKLLIYSDSEIVQEKFVTQSRSNSLKTFRLLEDVLDCAINQCANTIGQLRKSEIEIFINGEKWSMTK